MPESLDKDTAKMLLLIAENPGIDAKSLPRTRRYAILKTLELGGWIHYGPGGWYPVPKQHGKDEDCAPYLKDGSCLLCGVTHVETCGQCQGSGFHKPGCPASDEERAR